MKKKKFAFKKCITFTLYLILNFHEKINGIEGATDVM
jgi:hypothetical protein